MCIPTRRWKLGAGSWMKLGLAGLMLCADSGMAQLWARTEFRTTSNIPTQTSLIVGSPSTGQTEAPISNNRATTYSHTVLRHLVMRGASATTNTTMRSVREVMATSHQEATRPNSIWASQIDAQLAAPNRIGALRYRFLVSQAIGQADPTRKRPTTLGSSADGQPQPTDTPPARDPTRTPITEKHTPTLSSSQPEHPTFPNRILTTPVIGSPEWKRQEDHDAELNRNLDRQIHGICRGC